MTKKTQKFSADSIGIKETEKNKENSFYFGKQNQKLMLIGLALIIIGFLLMLGSDANTINGKFDPNSWNDDIFSIRRIRIAPLLVMAGFVVEVFAILKRNK